MSEGQYCADQGVTSMALAQTLFCMKHNNNMNLFSFICFSGDLLPLSKIEMVFGSKKQSKEERVATMMVSV